MNNITAWLRLRNAARFSRQVRGAARQIRDLGRAADDAGNQTDWLGNALSTLSGNIPQLTGRTRIFGFAVGTVVTFLVSMIPVVVGLGGTIVALAGSLAAATIGAGLFAGAMTGVLGAALGSVGIVLFDAMQNFQDVNERFQTWRQAVKAFGRDSEQAATAQKRLNAIVAMSGGPLVMEAVQTWSEFRDELAQEMQPVLEKIWMGMLQVFAAVRKLMPVWVRFNDIVVTALGPVLHGVLGFLTSAEFRDGFIAIGQTFANLAGPLGNGMLNIFVGLFRLVVRMLPFLLPVAQGFENITVAFMDWARTGNLNPFISQFMAWFNLIKAAGALLVTILSGGARSGQALVVTLTEVINKWNAALSTRQGQNGMTSFFADSIKFAGAFFKVVGGVFAFLFKFGRALLPLYTIVFKALSDGWRMLMEALAPAKPFWDNILGPLLLGIGKAVLDTVVGAFKFLIFVIKILAIVLGFIGKKLSFLKPIFFVLGYIIGVIFGGWILKILGWLGKLSILLKPLAFGFKMLSVPLRLAGWLLGKYYSFLFKGAKILVQWIASHIPAFARGIQKIVQVFTTLHNKFFNIGKQLWESIKRGFFQALAGGWEIAKDIGKAVINPIIKLLNTLIPNKIPIPYAPDIDLPDDPIPYLAAGGIVSGTGSWISGEAGPELNTLRNGRVTVAPLPAVSVPAPSTATLDPGRRKEVQVTKIFLKGRQIAEAVYDEAEDDAARR